MGTQFLDFGDLDDVLSGLSESDRAHWTDFARYSTTKEGRADCWMVMFAATGDADAVQHMANKVIDAIDRGAPLNPAEKLWAVETMMKVTNDRSIAAALSKGLATVKRGAPKAAWKAYAIASEVGAAVIDGARSIEIAQAEVASRHNLDVSTVRGYWLDNRHRIYSDLELANPTIAHEGGEKIMAFVSKKNRAAKLAKSPTVGKKAKSPG